MKKILAKTVKVPLTIAATVWGSLAAGQSGAAQQSLKSYRFEQQSYQVYRVGDLRQLQLALNHPQGTPLYGFAAWQQQLGTGQKLIFAMNAGMFHPDYRAVGLYIEKGRQLNPLNTDTDKRGNFFMQPNGVLAWNRYQAQILTTRQWQQHAFKADYATQSGPMLVINGKINQQFLPQSDSAKVRNGVGIKDGYLYFVISDGRVNFYQFARFFQQGLGVSQALYFDGSISSIYDAASGRQDSRFKLGPMIGIVHPQ